MYAILFLLAANPWQWPMYGQNLRNTHAQTGKGMIDVPFIKWSFSATTDLLPAVSGAAIADLDGDDYLEIIFGEFDTLGLSNSKHLYVLSYDGNLLWRIPLSDGSSTAGGIIGTPAIANIDSDNLFEIIIGTSTTPSGTLYVFNEDGSLLWNWNDLITLQALSSPKVADIDGDGSCEIVFGSCNWSGDPQGLYVLNDDASIEWSYQEFGIDYVSPAIHDIDGDGNYEIVSGGDGKLYVLEHDGSLKWSYPTGDNFIYSPAIADLDDNGSYEIIFLSASTLGKCWVLNANGAMIWNNPVDTIEETSPAIADIDGNNLLEVIVVNGQGVIYVFEHDGSILWTESINARMEEAPAVADIDGDNYLEIMCPNSDSGIFYCFNHDGSICWTIDISFEVFPPTIGDIDNDGCLEIIVVDPQTQKVYMIDDPYGATGCNGTGIEEEFNVNNKLFIRFNAKNKSLTFFLPSYGNVSLSLHDIAGRQIHNLISTQMGKGKYTIQLPSLSSGVYFSVLQHNNKRISHKFIKVN